MINTRKTELLNLTTHCAVKNRAEP